MYHNKIIIYYIVPNTGTEKLSKTLQPYFISKQIPYILNFTKNIVIPNDFIFTIVILSSLINGILTKVSNMIYTFF